MSEIKLPFIPDQIDIWDVKSGKGKRFTVSDPERSKREDFKIVEEIEVSEETLSKDPQPPKVPFFKDTVL